MRRRVRLTEGQLRGIVEESSRRVIQEMIDEGFFGDIGNALKSGWNSLTNSFGNSQTAKDVRGAYNKASNWATNAANSVGNAATNMYNGAKQGLQNAGNAIYQGAQNVGNAAQKYAPYAALGPLGLMANSNVRNGVANAAGSVAGNISQGANWVGNKVRQGVRQGVNQVGNALSGMGNAFSRGYQQGRR